MDDGRWTIDDRSRRQRPTSNVQRPSTIDHRPSPKRHEPLCHDLLSVGIDVGTTTTQIVFSHLSIQDTARLGQAPRIQVNARSLHYQSPIHFTPLRSETEVDVEALARLVRQEYRAAGVTPEQVETGAVIITGETARAQNADAILQALANLAGEFVVTVAGPNVEAQIAQRVGRSRLFGRSLHPGHERGRRRRHLQRCHLPPGRASLLRGSGRGGPADRDRAHLRPHSPHPPTGPGRDRSPGICPSAWAARPICPRCNVSARSWPT